MQAGLRLYKDMIPGTLETFMLPRTLAGYNLLSANNTAENEAAYLFIKHALAIETDLNKEMVGIGIFLICCGVIDHEESSINIYTPWMQALLASVQMDDTEDVTTPVLTFGATHELSYYPFMLDLLSSFQSPRTKLSTIFKDNAYIIYSQMMTDAECDPQMLSTTLLEYSAYKAKHVKPTVHMQHAVALAANFQGFYNDLLVKNDWNLE
jgi:hypothetical protein